MYNFSSSFQHFAIQKMMHEEEKDEKDEENRWPILLNSLNITLVNCDHDLESYFSEFPPLLSFKESSSFICSLH